MEALRQSPYFDVRQDSILFNRAVSNFGHHQAEAMLAPIFAENFHSQAWEITGLATPYCFYYHILQDGERTKLVHESSIYSGQDILEVTSPQIQIGLEYINIRNARARILAAEIDDSVAWVSPKNELYPKTQINIARKISQNLVRISQFQSEKLDMKLSARFLNCFSQRLVVDENPTREALMEAVGERESNLTDEEIEEMIVSLTGKRYPKLPELKLKIERESRRVGMVYLGAIKLGFTGEALETRHRQLLSETIDYQIFRQLYPENPQEIKTSCGIVTLSKPPGIGYSFSLPGFSFETRCLVNYKPGFCVSCGLHAFVGSCDICATCEKKTA